MNPNQDNLDRTQGGSLDEPTVVDPPAIVMSKSGSGFGHSKLSPFHFDRTAFLLTSLALLSVAFLISTAVYFFSAARSGDKAHQAGGASDNFSVSSLSTDNVRKNAKLQVGQVDQLAVNGQLKVSNTVVLSPTTAPTAPKAGQIYYDKNTQAPYYYNGSAFVSLAPDRVSSLGGATGAISIGNGLTVTNNQLSLSASVLQAVAAQPAGLGVTSLQGLTGDVNLTGGTGIGISGTTVTNLGVLRLTGTAGQVNVSAATGNITLSLPQNIDAAATPGFQGLILNSSLLFSDGNGHTTSLQGAALAQNQTIIIPDSGFVSDTVCLKQLANCQQAGTGVVSNGGSLNYLARFTDAGGTQIGNSLLYDNGVSVGIGTNTPGSGFKLDVNGSANVTGSATIGANLNVSGTVAFTNIGTGVVKVDNSGNLSGGSVALGSETTGNYVAALGTLTGLTVTGNSGAGATPNLSVAYGSTSGTAVQGNTTLTCTSGTGNLTGGGGVITLGSGGSCGTLSITNSPTFSGTLSVQGAGGITVGQASSTDGVVVFASSANSFLGSLKINSLGQNTTYFLPDSHSASDTICLHDLGNCSGSGNGVTTTGGTAGKLAVFTGSNSVGDSSISDDGSMVTIAGDLTVNAITASSLQSAGTFSLTSGGDLNIGTSNQVLALQGNGSSSLTINDNGFTSVISFMPVGGLSGNQAITFPDASGVVCLQNTNCGFAAAGSGVTSVIGTAVGSVTATGALTINNAKTTATAITIDDASTTAKGIASFNATNFSVSGGVVNTIQSIATTANVTFGSLTLGSGDLTLGAGKTVKTDNITTASSGSDLTLDAGNKGIVFKTNGGDTFLFPTGGGAGQTICTTGVTCASGGGQAVILEPGGGVQTASSDNTAIFVNKASGLGNLIQLQAGGIDTFVISNTGVVTAANLTVNGTLKTNTITPTGALTIGSTSQAFTLQGSSASLVTGVDAGFNTSLGFGRAPSTGAPTGSVTYKLQNDSSVAPGTYFVCTTAGNCAGVGGGVTTSGGTAGVIAKFTASGNIADSLLSESSNTITVNGNLAVGTSGASQLSIGVGSAQNGSLVFFNSTNGNKLTIDQVATAPGSDINIKLPNQSGTFAVSATGALSLDPVTGELSCATCLTSGGGAGGGVSSIKGGTSGSGINGDLTLQNATSSGTTLTIDNASTTAKGIASFNATNFSVVGGAVNTAQDIASTASPTFQNLAVQGSAGLTLGTASNLGQLVFKDGTNDGFTATFRPTTLTSNRVITIPDAGGTLAVSASGNLSLSATGALSITNSPTFSTSVTTPQLLGSSGLTVGSLSQALTLQGNGSTVLKSRSGSFTSTLGFAAATADRSITLPDASGEICLAAPVNNCAFAAGGSGVASLDGNSGALILNNSSASDATHITIDDASTSAKGIATFNASNFSVVSGAVNTIQDIATTATPTFAGLTVSGLGAGILQSNSGGAITSGAIGRNSSLFTGTLSVANGGTGLTSFTANGILYGSGSGISVTATANNSVLATNGSGVPSLVQTLPAPVQSNITTTGALGTGSIVSGFGSITTASNITTTASLQGGTFGAGSSNQFTIDASGNAATSGTLTLGVASSSAGSIVFYNASNGHKTTLRTLADALQDQTITIPASSATTDTVCLVTLANCTTGSGGSSNFINNQTTQQVSANFNIKARSGGTIAAVIQGDSGQDIANFVDSGGAVVAKVTSTGAIVAPTTTNTINGLVINGGALSSVAGITTSGGYVQTGSGANTLSGATTLTAAGTALTVNNNSLFKGTVTIGSSNQFTVDASGNLATSGTGSFGAGGLTLATAGAGKLTVTSASLSTNVALLIPATSGSSDTVCLVTLGNCTGANSGSGNGNYIQNSTAQQTNANFNISANGGVAAVIQGASGQDIININKSDTNSALKVASSGLVTASFGLTVNNGATLTGSVQINPSSGGNTTINSGTSTGTVTIGGTSAGAISLQNGSAGISATSAGSITLTAGGGGSNVGVVAKTGSDTTRAFEVQNAAGVATLSVDNTNLTVTSTAWLNITGISSPTGTLTSSGTGGSLPANTYYYRLAARNANGMAGAVNTSPASVTTTGSTSKNTITWSAATGATNYYLYRSTDGSTFYRISTGNVTTYTDDGSTVWSGTDHSGDASVNDTSGIMLAKGGQLMLDANGNGMLYEDKSNSAVVLQGAGANQAVVIQADSFYFEDTTGYNDNFGITNTGATLFKNRLDSTTAFQVQAAGSSTPLFNVDTTNGRVGVKTASPNVDFDVNGVSRGVLVQGTTGLQIANASTTGGYLSKSATVGTGDLSANDVVVLTTDAGNGNAVRAMRTSTPRDPNVYGVATAAGTNGNSLAIAISGNYTVNATTNAGVNPIQIGDQLVTSGTSGYVMADNTATTGIVGIALSALASGTGTVNVEISPVHGTSTPKYISNSTAAFQIQNTSGVSLLTADTSNMRLAVGSKGTATGQLYIAGQTPSAVFGQANGASASYGLAVQGRYAYAVPGNGTNGYLQVYDVSNPASPVLLNSTSTATSFNGNKKIEIAGKYAYVAGGGTFQVFDISRPANPVSVATQTYTAGSNIQSLAVQGRYAYVGESSTNSLYIFDISNPALIPSATVLTTGFSTASNGAADMYAQGKYVYTVNNSSSNAFQVIDVSNPAAPSVVKTIANTSLGSGTNVSIYVQGRYAYVGQTGGALYTINISDPVNAAVVGSSVSTGGAVRSIVSQGRYLYLTDATNNVLRTADISVPSAPVMVSGTVAAQAPVKAIASGRYLYVSNNSATNTLQVFDLGGAYVQQLEAGGIETDTLSVRSGAGFGGNVSIQGALSVGSGLQVAGNSGFSGAVAVQADNASAFQVQSSAGVSALNVDTTTLSVNVGGANSVTFGSGSPINTGNGPYDVATGDFNGDGKTDAITADYYATTTLFTNTGSGLPSTGTNLPTGPNPWAIATGDFNGDGKTDAITVNNGNSTASLYINTGSGLPASATTTFSTDSGPTGVAAADINGDGKMDAIVTAPLGASVRVYLGTATGINTTAAQNIGVVNSPQEVTAGDFNGDGKIDIAVSIMSVDEIRVFLNTGTALSTSPSVLNTGGANPISITNGDFNGDGKLDLAVANKTGGNVSIYLNNGTATPFNAAPTRNITVGTSPYGIASTDFNGDGRSDIVVTSFGATGNGTTASVITNPHSSVSAVTTNLTTGSGPLAVATGDFNADGRQDIIITNYGNTGSGTTASVFLNTTPYGSLTVSGTQTVNVNSSTAFQVKSAVSGTLLIADTANMSLTVNGSASFKNVTNSATAFQIQNASGASLFNVDTTTNTVTAGGGGGALGNWTSGTNSLSTAAQFICTFQANGYLFGFENASNAYQYAKLNANGTTGVWSRITTGARPDTRGSYACAYYNGYIYEIGGNNGSDMTSVYRARVYADGTLGSWTQTTSVNTARSSGAAAVLNGYIYYTGGFVSSGSTYSAVVESAKINADGTLGTWTAQTSMTAGKAGHGLVAVNGYLYAIGGTTTGGSYASTVYSAQPSSTGAITGWTSQNTLATAVANPVIVSQNGYIYVVAGQTGSFTAANTYQMAQVGTSGTLSTWTTGSTALTTNGRYKAAGTAYNGYVYIAGGYDPSASAAVSNVSSASTQRLKVVASLDLVGGFSGTGSDESVAGGNLTAANANILGGLQVQGPTQLTGALNVSGSVFLGGNSVIMQNQANSTAAFSVQNANGTNLFNADTTNGIITIGSNSTGATAPWTSQSGNLLPQGRAGAGVTTYNGYIYIIGGDKNGTIASTVMYAKVNADGSTGAWSCQGQNSNSSLGSYCGTTPVNSNTLPAARSDIAAVAHAGYLYTFGGYDGSTKYSNVYIAKINADGSTGAWVDKTSTYGTNFAALSDIAVVASNGYVYLVGGYPNSGSGVADAYSAKLGPNGTITNWNTYAGWIGGGAVNRRDMGAVVANGYLYAFAGDNGAANPNIHYAKINADGTLPGASITAASTLNIGQPGGSTFVMNGYLYVVGYYNGGVNGRIVQFAKLNSDGTVGPWSCQGGSSGVCGGVTPVNNNTLPAERSYYGGTGLTINGYMYVIGGNSGSGPNYSATSVYYTSGQRLQVNGSLDLVGGAASSLSDGGTSAGSSGGSLTAGNTRIIGSLDVQGAANFAQDVSITANLNVGGAGSFAGTLSVTGAVTLSSTLSVSGMATFSSGITVGGHIITTGTTPTTNVGVAAGTGGTCTVNGNDASGTVTIHATNNPGTGRACTITFNTPYVTNNIHVVIGPQGGPAAQVSPNVDNVNNASFDIYWPYAPGAGQHNTDHFFNYIVAESQ